jgi:hypothetical protein
MCGSPPQLSAILQDDLRVPIIFFDVPFDFDVTAFQLPDIAHMAQIAAKDDYLEWAGAVVFTEIEESGTGVETSNFDYFAPDALARAYMLGRLSVGNAFGGEQAGTDYHQKQHRIATETQGPSTLPALAQAPLGMTDQ